MKKRAFWRLMKSEIPVRALVFLMIFATFAVVVSAQPMPVCDPVAAQTVTRVSTDFFDSQTGASIGYSRYDIKRNGRKDHLVYLFVQAPATTVFKVYKNGTEMGDITPVMNGASIAYWSWDVWWNAPQPPHPPIGSVGDVITITKDSQPYLSGVYSRQTWDHESADGAASPDGNCNIYRGLLYLPTSSNPKTLRSANGVFRAPVAITKISVNEPSTTPGTPGPEIATIPISTSWVSGGVHHSAITNTYTPLSNYQFALVRQNVVTVNVFTANHPNGYVSIPVTTLGINTDGDYDGDGKSEFAVFRPSERTWYFQYSSNSTVGGLNFGLPTDKIVIGDYDTDRKADVTLFQRDNPDYPGLGVWQIQNSSNGAVRTIQWGLGSDIPLALNIDKNNTSDLAVFRPTEGMWYIRKMGDIIKPRADEFNNEPIVMLRWGTAGDIPIAADFNADGIDELTVFRPSDGNWYIYDYVSGKHQVIHWGANGDIPMARDFDGDRKADVAVFRPSEGNWYIFSSLRNDMISWHFGTNGDVPVAADFDQDSVADIAVFRPSDGYWYIIRSSNNSFYATKFGMMGDIPAVSQR